MEFKLSLEGKLDEYLSDEYSKASNSILKSVKEVGTGLKNDLRNQSKSGGLGKLSYSWRNKFYKNNKIDSASLVYSSAPKIMEGFIDGISIKSKDGFWLAIPAKNIRKKIRGKRVTPYLYEKAYNVRLRFIYRSNKSALLVRDYKKKTMIVFYLVPKVKMPKVVDFEKSANYWQNLLPSKIISNWR